MDNRVLMVASVPSMIGQFNMNNIKLLLDLGFKVDIACDFTDRSVWTKQRVNEFLTQIKCLNIQHFQIDFSRNPLSMLKHIQSYKQLNQLMKNREYKFVHCHTPIASAITRIVCKKNHIKVIYTAHGFHFYKGASLKNWLLYYPIEKILSKFTDALITINKEDYILAKDKFYAKKVIYIPGVGVITNDFDLQNFDRVKYRIKLGLTDKDFMIFSVGEINKNKNQQIIIKAIAQLKNSHIHYFIAGEGKNKEELKKLANKLGIRNQLHILGFRSDIAELNHCAEVFAFPSIREGLGLAAIESMACGTPLLVSNTRGINDYAIDNITGFSNHPFDVNGFAESITKLLSMNVEKKLEICKYNKDCARSYDVNITRETMKKVYRELFETKNDKL